MRFCNAASAPPDQLSGGPKMPNTKNNSVATITISFQPKFLFMKNDFRLPQNLRSQVSLRRVVGGSNRRYRAPGHFKPQIVRRNPEVDVLILERNDRTSQASGGYHLVPGFQVVQHGLPLLLAPLLRHDKQEIENGENKDERGKPQPSCRTTA